MIGYKINLSKGSSVTVDEAGYKKVLDNISSNFVMVNGELINPSFIISVTKIQNYEPEERKEKVTGHIENRDGKDVYVIDKVEVVEDRAIIIKK